MKPSIIKVKDQPNLVPTAKYPHAKFPFENFNPCQSRVFESYDKDVNFIVAIPTSSGKAQPDESLILTDIGYAKLNQIVIGDCVIGGDGHPTKIIGVYPQGNKEVYKVIFDDDTFTECCEDHLWCVNNRFRKSDKWMVVDIRFLIGRLKEIKKWYIPNVKPVHFPERQFKIHPYVLGMLIGDGGIKYNPVISNKDNDVLDRFERLLPEQMHLVKYDSSIYYKGCDYRIISEIKHYNPIARHLNLMGLLGKGSHEKFIPYIYKYSSIEQRIELLRGLLDSDGYRQSGGSAEFGTSSYELAEDVAFLVRSLGGRTKIRKKTCVTYKYKGEERKGKPCYKLNVSLEGINPFFCERKSKNWISHQRRKNRNIVSVEKVGIKSCRCIKVANEDGLYITNDFIVTHNTVCSELLLANEIRANGNKGMYLSPLRALSQERIDDWSSPSHHFHDLKKTICTGDYRLTANRKKEIDESDLVIMTTEMLNSCSRNAKSERNDFLKSIKTLVCDELQILREPNRGDHIESGIMKFTEINPECRIVGLSATLPNVDEVGQWLSKLNGKNTIILESTYRPCPLKIHYVKYYDVQWGYDENEQTKVRSAIKIVEEHTPDKFILFVHTKKTGKMLFECLQERGILCEYHNADLTKEKRVEIERRFREDNKLRCLVATSGMSQGLNTPARRVIVVGVHRGIKEVDTNELLQEAGRSGRPQYDTQGDAYILLPNKTFDKHKKRLEELQPIESQMKDGKCLAFHLTSEVHHRNIQSLDDIHDWYERSLAHHQAKELDDEVVSEVIKGLTRCGAVIEENKTYETTSIGNVASMFYFSPYDVSDLSRNWTKVFERNKESDDYWIGMALGNIDSLRIGIVSNADKEEIAKFRHVLDQTDCEKALVGSRNFTDGAIKAGCCYFNLLKGSNSIVLGAVMRGLQMDFERLSEVLCALDTMTGKWEQSEYFRRLQLRVLYGVGEELLDLVKIQGIGKVKAKRLWDANLRSLEQVSGNVLGVIKALNCSKNVAEIISKKAKELM